MRLFLPHTIEIIRRQVTIVDGESRRSEVIRETVKANVYKKEKASMTEWQKERDDEKDEYQVIIKPYDIHLWDVIIPNVWYWPMGDYIVISRDPNNEAYTKALRNTHFTIKAR